MGSALGVVTGSIEARVMATCPVPQGRATPLGYSPRVPAEGVLPGEGWGLRRTGPSWGAETGGAVRLGVVRVKDPRGFMGVRMGTQVCGAFQDLQVEMVNAEACLETSSEPQESQAPAEAACRSCPTLCRRGASGACGLGPRVESRADVVEGTSGLYLEGCVSQQRVGEEASQQRTHI